jgi:hypothetical protein
LVLDASRRNPFERRFRSYSAGLGAIQTAPNTIIISAASPGKVIGDADANSNSFMDELLKQTSTPRLPMADIFNHTRERFPAPRMASRFRGYRSIFPIDCICAS